MNDIIPLSVPNLKGNEKKYVLDALESEWISTGGSYITDFEAEISKYLNIKSSVACQSGTAAIHLSLILSGVSDNDEVIVPTLTFIAAINPVKYVNATPIFMDCDDSLCLDADKLMIFCSSECLFIDNKLINKQTNKIIKAIIVVHVFGNLANMEKIMSIANKYNLKVIEDSTEALGSKYTSGKFLGKFAGTIGDFGAYSFNGNKIISTGGGGMLVAKDESLLAKAKYLSTQAKDNPLYYIHNEIGFNYRMTNLQAALGLAQIEKLNEFISIKKENYHLYQSLINDIAGLSLLNFKENTSPNYWFYSLLIDENIYPLDRDSLIEFLNSKNIQTRPIWALIHTQKPYQNCRSYKIEKASYFIKKIINIPCSTNLSKDNIFYISDILKSIKKIK